MLKYENPQKLKAYHIGTGDRYSQLFNVFISEISMYADVLVQKCR